MKYHFNPWNHEIWLNLEVEILTEWNIGLFISIMFRSDFDYQILFEWNNFYRIYFSILSRNSITRNTRVISVLNQFYKPVTGNVFTKWTFFYVLGVFRTIRLFVLLVGAIELLIEFTEL